MDRAAVDTGFRHAAWLYRTRTDYLDGLRDFIDAGLARGEPVFVVVPGSQVPAGWLPRAADLTVADMRDLGGNPARLIPALRAFADRFPGRRVRYLGEPAWPGRSGAELREIARHEGLLNLAFASSPISALCPYDASALSAVVLADASAAHPSVHGHGDDHANDGYQGLGAWPASLTAPLIAPPDARVLAYDGDLRGVRALVACVAAEAGLSQSRCTDLVIAASEVAANTLRHTRSGGFVRLWQTATEVLCQLEDTGFIADPLAGHWRPRGDAPGGQGLWLVNQMCDLAEIRSGELGTTIRLHMRRT